MVGAAAALMIAAATMMTALDTERSFVRYHQHLREPGEAQLGEKPQGAEWATHLPLLSIDTGGRAIPGEAILNDQMSTIGVTKAEDQSDGIVVQMELRCKEGAWHQPGDAPDLTSKAVIRIRGNSSRRFAKKSYRLELVQDGHPELKNKQDLLGMGRSGDWVLHGPFLDKTLMRNYMWMNLSGEIMGNAPEVRFCELMIDGEYKGLYVLMETIEVGEERLQLSAYRDGDPVTSYLLHLETRAQYDKSIESFSFYTKRLEPRSSFEIAYPTRSHLTDAVKTTIEQDFSEIQKAIFSRKAGNDDDFYTRYLDEDSFIDYYILMEFLAVTDMFSSSTYFYKDVRGKLCIGPVWDFNNALDNYFTPLPADEFLLMGRGWYGQLMKSEGFVRKLLRRYRELRRGVLSEEALKTYVRETEEWLGSAVERNFSVWGDSFDWTKLTVFERRRMPVGEEADFGSLNPSSYAEATEQMVDFMVERGEWLDRHIDSLLQYCQPSKNAATALY